MSDSKYISKLKQLRENLKDTENNEEVLVGHMLETIIQAYENEELDYLANAIIRWVNNRLGNDNISDVDLKPPSKN